MEISDWYELAVCRLRSAVISRETLTMTGSAQYFSQVAEEWDDLRAGYFTEAMRDDAIARAQLPQGAVVADVGTGTGFVLQGLLSYARRLVGFDASEEMLAVAEANLAQAARASGVHIDLRLADGADLPAEDGQFDAVFANMYLHHVADPEQCIAEMVRVLKPGGRLVITDLDSHEQAWMRDEMADHWLGFARKDVRSWFAAAGLHDVGVEDAGGSCNCSDTPAGEAISLSVFVALGTK